ncbi:MAG: transcriptional regulator [Thermoprotei archaeon]|nr:MAG: transcriptional regulator [Thermoprotei archaeon]RLE97743.1 MAG: transcriptional regulator [Thermoprotei archaeon]RLE97875.1 MAG: transcriptional regulator [Thermoprotei archaeon]
MPRLKYLEFEMADEMSSVVDEKDLEIIRLLEENARMPLTRIAARVGMSDVAVRKRLKKLEEEGVIKAYRPKLDHAKLGYRARAIIGFDVDPARLLEVVKKLAEKPEVKFLAITSGDHMVMVDYWARDNKELESFIEELRSKYDVSDIRPALVLEVVKE